MNCGEFDKRNKEYVENFDIEKYFKYLILGDEVKNYFGKDKVIFDVGAHKGESARFFKKIFPESLIYCFEPTTKLVEFINASNMSNVKVIKAALSNFNGIANFNIQDISHLSSLHEINKNSISSLNYARNENHEVTQVKVMRGDDFMESRGIKKIDFLKVDVQANELNVLQGFSKKINQIKCVFVEVSFYDFYNTKTRLKDIESSIPGFDLYDIYEVSKNPKTNGTDWATFVYLNKNQNA